MSLSSEENSLLRRSVMCYLHKSLGIQDDSWKTCPLNLEDMFKHYLETSSSANVIKKEGDQSSEEAGLKKKKGDGIDDVKGDDIDNVVADINDVELKTKKEGNQSSEEVGLKKKKKKKKKKKGDGIDNVKGDDIDNVVADINDVELKTKKKSKEVDNEGVEEEKKESKKRKTSELSNENEVFNYLKKRKKKEWIDLLHHTIDF